MGAGDVTQLSLAGHEMPIAHGEAVGPSLLHGHARKRKKSPTYHSWASMVKRCTNPNATRWGHYGGRGITVCARWRTFANFLVDMGEKPPGLSIDRIDNGRGYEPGNCRWATHREQCRNKRNSKLTADDVAAIRRASAAGEKPCPIARRYGVNDKLIRNIVDGVIWQ